MIAVAVYINGSPVTARHARNIGKSDDNRHVYEVDDGRTIVHRREDGAIALAIELLKGIKEPRS